MHPFSSFKKVLDVRLRTEKKNVNLVSFPINFLDYFNRTGRA